MAISPITKLQAVNRMLSSIGETAVVSIPSTRPDASLAETELDNISRDVQQEGWHFNTEEDVELTPIANEIAVPSDALRIDPCNASVDYVWREGKLYDRENNTFTITSSVKVNIVRGLDFEDMPEAARQYIHVRAARSFQDKQLGATDLHGYQATDEMRSRVELEDADCEMRDGNAMLNRSTIEVMLDREEW